MINSLFEYLENLRRNAYVKAVMRASESDDVLGFIGSRLPVEIFHALDLYSIPVYGVDGEILKFSCEKNLCPVIDATVTYAKTDKCPLIHSSKLIVVENSCPIMTREIMKLDKNIYIYESESELVKKLLQVYHRELDFDSEKLQVTREKLLKIHDLIKRIKYYSDLTGLQVYILEFYLNFLGLDERINILQELSEQINFSEREVNYIPVKVQSSAGIYRHIDKLLTGRNYRILEDFCNIDSKNLDFVYHNCPYHEGERINY